MVKKNETLKKKKFITMVREFSLERGASGHIVKNELNIF